MPDDKRKQVLIRMDQELYDQLEEMADYFGGPRNVNATILRYIRMGLTVDEGVTAAGRDSPWKKGAQSD